MGGRVGASVTLFRVISVDQEVDYVATTFYCNQVRVHFFVLGFCSRSLFGWFSLRFSYYGRLVTGLGFLSFCP